MREGYWINYQTAKQFPIDEHERWLRKKGNAKKLGVPQRVIDGFGEFEPVKDRDKFLLFVMQHAPVMRVRGHGNYATFEYASRRERAPMEAIWLWGMENAGPRTGMYIVNFATNDKMSTYWDKFDEAMNEGGASQVMRVASTTKMRWKEEVARDILALSRRLIGEKEVPGWHLLD